MYTGGTSLGEDGERLAGPSREAGLGKAEKRDFGMENKTSRKCEREP